MKLSLKENAVFVPRTLKPTSFDPLDADQANNIWVMRMLHLTPLEVSVSNRLTSQILSSFSYDSDNARITFVVRGDRTFSDGTPIRPEDVAFSISRMALTRPKFPVISEIDGLPEWVKASSPLATFPRGVQVNGDTVTISFTHKIENPLFRFALEIFSIVPKDAVDLATNKLKTPRPPTSGNYRISADTEEEIVFELRMSPSEEHKIEVPRKISFLYPKTEPDFANFMSNPPNMVFAGLELALRSSRVDLEEQGAHVIWTPASSFAVVVLNPKTAPFDDPGCRRMFAAALREEVANQFGDAIGVEPGLFPVIVPGYVPASEFAPEFDVKACSAKFHEAKMKWTKFPSGQNDFYNGLIEKTAIRLGVQLELTATLASPRDHELAFKKLDSCCFFGRSGFWPLDPVGDIRMLFAPNMHKGLEVVWSDQELASQLDQLGHESDPTQVKSMMQKLNRYVVDKAVFNVVAHFRRFFASSGAKTLRSVPLAIQQPYAWQAFNVD